MENIKEYINREYAGDYYADEYYCGHIEFEEIPDKYIEYVNKKLAIDHMM